MNVDKNLMGESRSWIPGSSQWSSVKDKRQQAGTKICEFPFKHRKITLLTWRWSNTVTSCWEMLWSLHLWKYSKPVWRGTWTTCSMWPCLEQGVGQDNCQRCLLVSGVAYRTHYQKRKSTIFLTCGTKKDIYCLIYNLVRCLSGKPPNVVALMKMTYV